MAEAQRTFLCTGSQPACPIAIAVKTLVERQALLPDDYVVILVPDAEWQTVAKAFKVNTPFGFTLLSNRRMYLNRALMSQDGNMPAFILAHETAHVVCGIFNEARANRAARKIVLGFSKRICD
jgi:hypothetical protein